MTKNYTIYRKTHLSDKEKTKLFSIIENNMKALGYNVTSSDKESWLTNLKNNLENGDFYLYVIYFDGHPCGFAELIKSPNGLCLSEIQFSEKVKNTKLILYLLKFLANEKCFADYNKLFFNISKKNIISNKTFSHLGGKIIEERENSYKYEITRDIIEKYVNKFNI